MRDLTASEWADYDRVALAIVRAGFSCADVRLLRDGVTPAIVRRAIEADTDAADAHGRACLYAERMEAIEAARATP